MFCTRSVHPSGPVLHLSWKNGLKITHTTLQADFSCIVIVVSGHCLPIAGPLRRGRPLQLLYTPVAAFFHAPEAWGWVPCPSTTSLSLELKRKGDTDT
mmetsp:Transcript_8223/g.14700  ORF Transcript_8223/g.14700 Transcript_8223/m.14700 type:complete len:98 (+) Transcript_8223:336-629(+)